MTGKIRRLKADRGYALYGLSKRVDVQPSVFDSISKVYNRIRFVAA